MPAGGSRRIWPSNTAGSVRSSCRGTTGSTAPCCAESAPRFILSSSRWTTIASTLRRRSGRSLRNWTRASTSSTAGRVASSTACGAPSPPGSARSALQHVLGADTARRVSGFRALRTGLRDAFAGYRGPFVNLDVLLTWGTDRFTSIGVHHRSRHSGTSNYTARKLIEHALNMLTGFATVPLQLVVTLGFALSVFGLVLLGYVLGRYLVQGVAVPGFTFLASVIVIFSGAQLFTLGVIGEYLARMHYRMMAKPAYVVRADSRASGVREGPARASADEVAEP